VLVAPDDELANIKLVSVPGQAAIAGQKPRQRKPAWIREPCVEGDDRSRR
jgi:hypothetical protein